MYLKLHYFILNTHVSPATTIPSFTTNRLKSPSFFVVVDWSCLRTGFVLECFSAEDFLHVTAGGDLLTDLIWLPIHKCLNKITLML